MPLDYVVYFQKNTPRITLACRNVHRMGGKLQDRRTKSGKDWLEKMGRERRDVISQKDDVEDIKKITG